MARKQKAPPTTHVPTGDGDLDTALGGGWPLGSVVELSGDAQGLLTHVAVFGGDPDEAIARADDALQAGVVVAVRVPPADLARAARLLSARASERGAAVLLLRTTDPTAELLEAQVATEARMRADAEAVLGGGAGAFVAARVSAGPDGVAVARTPPRRPDAGQASDGGPLAMALHPRFA